MNSPLNVPGGDEKERREPYPGPNSQNRQQQPVSEFMDPVKDDAIVTVYNRYKFSPEELRVLKRCNNESFIQRCLPLGTLFGCAAYYGVKSGKLSGNPRFGAAPKVVGAVIVGYFMGKFSYQRRCAEMLMELPNSQLGQSLRQRKKGILRESIDPGFGPSMSLSPFAGITDSYSDINPNRNSDMDFERPHPEGLDDSFRPSMDNPITIQEEELPVDQKQTTTYEELRKKNREEYEQKRLANYRDASKAFQPPPSSARPTYNAPVDDYSEGGASGEPKNKYGDVWG